MQIKKVSQKPGLFGKPESKYILENTILLIIFTLTWLGFGRYMAPLLLLAFIPEIFFKEKREFLFRDRFFLFLVLGFTFFSFISSLLSIDKLVSAVLSLVWFLIIFVPYSYVQFSLRGKNFFINWIVPVSFIISIFIIGYLFYDFIKYINAHGFHLYKRHTFIWLGKATTPDTIVMLTGIGYAFIRGLQFRGSQWVSFLYLLFCGAGMVLTYDRGGVVSFFIISVLLLLTDYKRLIIFLFILAVILFLSFKVSYFEPLRHFFDFLYSSKIRKALESKQQLDTFKTAWLMIKDHWFFGVGTNNFSKFSKQYGSGNWYAYAHNFILQFWAENGIIGLLLAISMFFVTFYRWAFSLKRVSSNLKVYLYGTGVSLIGMLIGNLTNSTIWIVKIALPFWMIVGLINGFYLQLMDEKVNKS